MDRPRDEGREGLGREGYARPERSDRERGDRSRDRSRDRERPARADRAAGPGRGRLPDRGRDRERPPERERERPPSRAAGPVSPGTGAAAPAEKEFWEVWSEEKAAAQRVGEAGPSERDAAPTRETDERRDRGDIHTRPPEPLPAGLARLYLNLGRKDGASEAAIRSLLHEHASVSDVPEIDVMNTHTYLNVAGADADRICASLTGRQNGDRALVCERARPRR